MSEYAPKYRRVMASFAHASRLIEDSGITRIKVDASLSTAIASSAAAAARSGPARSAKGTQRRGTGDDGAPDFGE